MNKDKLEFVKVLENFFEYNNIKYHELFFIYQYHLDELDFNCFLNIKDNLDNRNSYFEFVNMDKLIKINLLPVEVIETIKTLED